MMYDARMLVLYNVSGLSVIYNLYYNVIPLGTRVTMSSDPAVTSQIAASPSLIWSDG